MDKNFIRNYTLTYFFLLFIIKYNIKEIERKKFLIINIIIKILLLFIICISFNMLYIYKINFDLVVLFLIDVLIILFLFISLYIKFKFKLISNFLYVIDIFIFFLIISNILFIIMLILEIKNNPDKTIVFELFSFKIERKWHEYDLITYTLNNISDMKLDINTNDKSLLKIIEKNKTPENIKIYLIREQEQTELSDWRKVKDFSDYLLYKSSYLTFMSFVGFTGGTIYLAYKVFSAL